MTNSEKKYIAEQFYGSISVNEILSSRVATDGSVVLKVYNHVFKSHQTMWVLINENHNELALQSKIGLHYCADLKKFYSSIN